MNRKYLQDYRNRCKDAKKCSNNGDFIASSLSRCEVEHYYPNYSNNISAIIVTDTSRQKEVEETFVYTYPKDNVRTGDFIKYKNTHYLLFRQTLRVALDEENHMFKAIECNVELNELPEGATWISYYGSYKDPEKLDKLVKLGLNYTSLGMHPTVISSGYSNMKINDRYKIGEERWRIINSDVITSGNRNIHFHTLENVTSNYDDVAKENIIPREQITNDTNVLKANSTITFNLTNGFVKFNKTVDVIYKNNDVVVFKIPNGINELEVTTEKNTTTYKVVI